MKRFILALVLGAYSLSAQSALIDRGGGLIYDDVLDVTWLQDANYGAGSIYDDLSSTTDGKMSWDNAVAWAANLSYYDSVRDVAYDNWRLPVLIDIGNDGCNFSYDGTDCGFNVDTSTGELAHLFYLTLENLADFDTSGDSQPGGGLSNSGPFININTIGAAYHYGTEYAPDSDLAWHFGFAGGTTSFGSKSSSGFAWAVMDGDVAPAPASLSEPGTLALFGIGLAGLGLARRRKIT